MAKGYFNGVLRELTVEEVNELNVTDAENFTHALEQVRLRRNEIIAETDYIITKHTEADTTIPTEWKTYRTALRDITNNLTTVDDVNAITWPTKPSE